MMLNVGYASAEALIGLAADEVLSAFNLTVPYSTRSVWDGLRWPTSSANISLVGSPPLLGSHGNWAGLDAQSAPKLLMGAAVDESGCLVLPTQPWLSVLIFWVSPFVTAAAGLVAAALAMLLSRYFRHDEATGGGVSKGGRIFILCVAIAAASLWVSGTIAGASMGVSKVIMLGIFVLITVITVLIDRLFGWRTIIAALVTREPLARRLVRFLVTSDWSRSCAVAIASPVLALFLLLSVGNQFIRVHLLRTARINRRTVRDPLWVTPKVHAVLKRLRAWNWTSVLRKVIVLCVFYIVWVVGVMKVTKVFFSWLSHELTKLNLIASTVIFVSVGMVMFLLPPVPGAPVYTASGVLLTASARQRFGYWPACFYAMAVAYCIKLGACCLQQKVIGGNLRRSVSVRSACAINSPLMRAIKLVMSEKRTWTKGKVATLVGGPDWPTSVMMGLMGMRLTPMLLGTMPVIFLVAPLSLTGSFMIMGDTSPYPALINIAIALSGVTQVGAFVALLHYVEQHTQHHRDDMEQLPYDLEVLAHDQKNEEFAALHAELIQWQSKKVPFHLRLVLVAGAGAGIFSCQLATLRGQDCFRDFALYPDFPTQLRDNLGGKIGNMIMYPGYCVLGLILFSYLCRYLFCCWAAGLAKRRYASGQRPKFANRKPLAEDPLRDEPVVPILLRAAAAKADTYTYTMARGSGGVAPSPPPRHSGSGVAAGAERVKPPWEMRLKAEQTEADETGVSGRRGPYPNMLRAA